MKKIKKNIEFLAKFKLKQYIEIKLYLIISKTYFLQPFFCDFVIFKVKNAENFLISLDLYTTITKNGNFSIKSTLSIKRTPKLFFAKSSIKRTLQSQN